MYFEEERLLRRAEVVVDREANHPLPPQERQQLVQNMRQELLERHECDHPGRFERVERGRGNRTKFECEMCADQHRTYILRCRRCHIQVCEACRRHRIRYKLDVS